MVAANERKIMGNLVDIDRGLISREIFTSDELYQQQLERIFARAWLFVGHESQIPNPNDFFVSRMGEESVILTRDRQNQIHVLLNTCMHRGMKVCRYDEGNTPVFSCPYHGWSYSTDGNLVSVPGELIGVPQFATAYHGELKKEEWGLISVPKMHIYKGSIWACGDNRSELGRLRRRHEAIPGWVPRRCRRRAWPDRSNCRRPEVHHSVELDVRRRKLHWRLLPRHQPPLGRPRGHQSAG